MAPQPTPSPFTVDELARWREILLAQARSLRADVEALASETVLQERVGPNHHVAESAAELQSAGIDAAAATDEQEELRLVLRALRKIDAAEPVAFGVCELTGRAIERERLELMPWTPLCAEASARLEREGRALVDVLSDEAAPR